MLLRILVGGVEWNVVFTKPRLGLLLQVTTAHRVENEPATIGGQLFQHGYGSDVVANLGIGVCDNRTIQVDGYNCILNGHKLLSFAEQTSE